MPPRIKMTDLILNVMTLWQMTLTQQPPTSRIYKTQKRILNAMRFNDPKASRKMGGILL